MSLTPSNKNNPCPICENTAGKCRQGKEDQDYWQCMTYPDSRKGEIVNGYKCIGHTRDRLWGQFKLDNSQEWSEQQRQEWQWENLRRNIQKAKANDERRQQSLTPEQRHEQYTQLLSELTLHPDDRADLVRRGFTDEQIEVSGFKSIERYQRLKSQYNDLLPGISRGNRLIIADKGYLCPIRNTEGLIVACQVRLRTLPTTESSRYRWLSGGEQTLHLYPDGCKPDGELPLPIFPPQGIPQGIALAEGTGAKPFLVSQRLNLFTIGAAGGQWSSSPEFFRLALEKAGIEAGTKEIKIFPDAGDILNPSVMSRWQRVILQLEEWGWSVQIGWWGQVDKSHPDIDELDDSSKIEFISCEDFNSWLEKGAKTPLKTKPTIFDIPNPPLIASSLIQSLKDDIFKFLPIPDSVNACFSPEEKAPRKERKWFESVLKRFEKAFSKEVKKQKQPRLGFNCFKEDNPEFEEKIRKDQRKLRTLSYDADIETHGRYLPNDLVTQLPKSGFIGIKAPKGSGKSELLKKIVAIAKKQGITILSITPRIVLGRAQAFDWEITWIDDYGVMQTRAGGTTAQIQEVEEKRRVAEKKLAELESINHQQLNLLDETEAFKLEQQKEDLGIEIERYGEEIENINSASVRTLALCWDSLWRTKDRNLKEGLIIIDEAELGFQHFITGSTCKRNRPYLEQTFKEKLTECLMSGGRVILSDADLTDLPIDYVRKILPIPIKPFIVTNDYSGEDTRYTVDFRTGSRGDTIREMIEAIASGKYLVITTDSQREAEALEELILKKYPDQFCVFLDAEGNITQDAQFSREIEEVKGSKKVKVRRDKKASFVRINLKNKKFKEAKKVKKALIVRVDSTTSKTKAIKEFIKKPNEQILHWKPRILIYTPSMGVGVSIDKETQRWDNDSKEMVPYFDAVYGLFFGTLEPSQCRQQLARIRANVPRIVYCKEFNRALEGCPSFFPEEVNRQSLKYNQLALSILDIATGVAGYEADDEQLREVMLQRLNDAWDKDSRCWTDPSIILAAKFKARENYSKWNLANLLREELEDEGHTVISITGMKTDDVEVVSEIKEEKKLKEATLVSHSSVMLNTSHSPAILDTEEATKVLYDLGSTDEQKRSAQKTLLQDELPGVELTPEFIKKAVVDDHRRWLNQHRLFWYCQNTKAVKEKDTEQWLKSLKKFAEGTPFMRDIRSDSPKVKAILDSGVFEFIDLQDFARIYQGDSPEAKTFLKKCLKNKDSIETGLNIRVTKKYSPIALGNKILGKFGLGLEKLTKSKKDNRYCLAADLVTDPDRVNVLKAFELRWQMSQDEIAQKMAEKEAQTQNQQATQPEGEVEEVSQGVNEPTEMATPEPQYGQVATGQTSKQPTEQTIEQPVEQTIEQPVEQTIEQPFAACRSEVISESVPVQVSCADSSAQPESTGSEPVDELVSRFTKCENEELFRELAKFAPEGNSSSEKEELVEAAIPFTGDKKWKLWKWWKAMCFEIKDFWHELDQANQSCATAT